MWSTKIWSYVCIKNTLGCLGLGLGCLGWSLACVFVVLYLKEWVELETRKFWKVISEDWNWGHIFRRHCHLLTDSRYIQLAIQIFEKVPKKFLIVNKLEWGWLYEIEPVFWPVACRFLPMIAWGRINETQRNDTES